MIIRFLLIVSCVFLISCKKNDAKEKNAMVNTKAYKLYYPNGKLKEAGFEKNNNRSGWSSFYDEKGRLESKCEFLVRNNISYLNQKRVFSLNGDIDTLKSSFFVTNLTDTIPLGKSIYTIQYYNNPKTKSKTRFVYVIIENNYSKNIIKKDTFTDDIDKLWFGINALKVGPLKVKGIIEEEISSVQNSKKDSFLKIEKSYKYFEKNVFVKNKHIP